MTLYLYLGIDICKWKVQSDETEITYNIWDFAGQTVYYNTHQVYHYYFLCDVSHINLTTTQQSSKYIYRQKYAFCCH